MPKLIRRHCWFAETFLLVPLLSSTQTTVDSFHTNDQILTSSVYLCFPESFLWGQLTHQAHIQGAKKYQGLSTAMDIPQPVMIKSGK